MDKEIEELKELTAKLIEELKKREDYIKELKIIRDQLLRELTK